MGVYHDIHMELAIVATPVPIKEVLGNVPSIKVRIYYRNTYDDFLLHNIKPERDIVLQYLLTCAYTTNLRFNDYTVLNPNLIASLQIPSNRPLIHHQFNTLVNNGRKFRKLIGDIGINSLHLTYGIPVRADIMCLEKIKIEYIETLSSGEHKIRLHNYNETPRQLTVNLQNIQQSDLSPLIILLKTMEKGNQLYQNENNTRLLEGLHRFLGNKTLYDMYQEHLYALTPTP